MMKTAALIVSAGRGVRLPGDRKKPYLLLGDKPILCHTLDPFEACPSIDSISIVVGPEDREYCLREIVEPYGYRKVRNIISGGLLRQDSVRNGIEAIPGDVEWIVIHDGVRPFVTRKMIESSIRAAQQYRAVVTAVPVKETIKKAAPDQTVSKTLSRDSLWQVQTPQAFQAGLIRDAFRKAAEDHYVGTDDASLVERIGIKVYILEGSYSNIKITTPEDLVLAGLLLDRQRNTGR